MSQRDITRLELVSRFLEHLSRQLETLWDREDRTIEATRSFSYSPLNEPTIEDWDSHKHKFDHYSHLDRIICHCAANFYRGYTLNDIDDDKEYITIALVLIPEVYGCVHIGALCMVFPTGVEMLMWKTACYYLIALANAYAIHTAFAYPNNRALIIILSKIHKISSEYAPDIPGHQMNRGGLLRALCPPPSLLDTFNWLWYILLKVWTRRIP